MQKPIIFFSLLLSLLLCGCFDYNELNMQELVSGVGIDSADGEISVSVQCAATDAEEDGAIYQASGKSFFDAVRNISLKNPKKLYWGHTQTLILGESAIAESDSVFDAILRARDIHLDIIPIVAKGATASDITKSKAANGDPAADALFSAFANEKNSRRFRAVRLWELLREQADQGFCILPAVELRGDEPAFAGGAVLRENNDAIYLSGEQILLLSLLRENGGGGYLPPIAVGKGEASFEILARKLRHRGDEISLHLVLSPAEVQSEMDVTAAEKAAKEQLDASFRDFAAFLSDNKLASVLGGADSVTTEITISNILGGRR